MRLPRRTERVGRASNRPAMPGNNTPSRQLDARRVIYAWNYVEWGGAQVYFWALMREAARHAAVEVLLPEGTHPQVLTTLDGLGAPYATAFPPMDNGEAPTLVRKIARHWAKVRSELAMVRALRRRVHGEVVLHLDLAPWQSMTALWWLARRTPVFVTCHTGLARHSWWREVLWRCKFGVLARCANFNILTSNQEARASLARMLPSAALERVRVTYTGINPTEIEAVRGELIDVPALRRRWSLPPQPFLVACVGQFIDRKGRWPFLEAARQVAAARQDIGFVWLSNSGISDDDRARVEHYGLGRRFRLLTATDLGADHRDVFRLLRTANVFCLPTFTDGLPIALLEAMALGLPSISTPVYAIPEAIVDGDTGLLVPPGDATALASAIVMLKNDAVLRRDLGARGRAHVLARFDERESARRAWAAYASAAGW